MAEFGLLCCAYILGLLCTALPLGTVLCVGLFLGIALLRSPHFPIPVPHQLRYVPTVRWWVMAVLVGLLAAGYGGFRAPQPMAQDVSRLMLSTPNTLALEVMGTIEQRPMLTRRGSFQVWLDVKQAVVGRQVQSVTGKLYVTLPAKVAKDLHPGQSVRVTGQLYKPQSATRPQGFDFSTFLARQGAFAGLKGNQVQVDRPGSAWGGWAVRQRIVRSLQKGTDPKTGALLSALVLGKDAADVPYDWRDSFVRVGLAHALAASGFQVSLILGMVLSVGRFWSVAQQVSVGAGALLFYGLLTGAEPSIVRAILMGFAGLIALALQRQVRPVGVLLVIATGMLLYNPLWIWDLGFQLSVLATLGLLVTVPPLVQGLDRLPPTLATTVAVPLAATMWTLPLQLYTFGVLPLYSLLANVLTAFLLSILTLGGFIASMAALLWPDLGALLAQILFWPTQGLVAIVMGLGTLPGHTLALGSISLAQLLALYGLLGAVWLWPWWQRQWRLAALLGFLLVVVPLWQVQTQRFLITVFDQTRTPMMVVEHPKGTVVLNSGNAINASQSLVPFLQRQGINRIDWAIATRRDTDPSKSGWSAILERMTIRHLSRCLPQAWTTQRSRQPQPQRELDVNPQERIRLGPIQMVLWRAQPTVLELQIDLQHWLLVDGSNETDFSAWLSTVQLPTLDVLWWTGEGLSPTWVQQLHPQVLVLSGQQQPDLKALNALVHQVWWTGKDGTVQWTPRSGFTSTVNPGENTLALF